MLYFITGPNGGGKTLRAVWMMEKLAKEGVNVYAWNFDSLNIPGVVIHQNVDPVNWRELPPNSALFVDEAQQVWRQRRGNKEEPPELRDMEEHRKAGIDIYLIAPSPTFIDNHIKPLVHKHWHCIAYGQNSSRIFEFSECQDNPQGMTKRAQAKFEVWDHPPKCYTWFKSSEAHLKKPPIPWRHRLNKVFKVGIVFVVLGILWIIFGPKDKAPAKAQASEQEEGGFSLFGKGSTSSGARPRDPVRYLADFTPRIPEMPWSAPAFDGQQVAVEPKVYCMASEDSCRCMTEQATVYVMPHDRCVRMARWGAPYNPFQAPRQDTPAPAPAPVAQVEPEPTRLGDSWDTPLVIPGALVDR